MTRLVMLFTLIAGAMSAQAPHCINPQFDAEVRHYLKFSVPVMDVDQLAEKRSEIILLDSRELEEYEVSHIPGARYVGYKDFDPSLVGGIDRNSKVVVYCAIGYRSEKIAERLQKMGFTDVHNLYGSIFEWVNRGHPLETNEGKQTTTLHTFSEKWGKRVTGPGINKVW